MLPFCEKRCGSRVEYSGSNLCFRCKNIDLLSIDDDTNSIDSSSTESNYSPKEELRKIRSTTELNQDNKNFQVFRRGPTTVFDLFSKFKTNRQPEMSRKMSLSVQNPSANMLRKFINVLNNNNYREIQDMFMGFISTFKKNQTNMSSLELSSSIKSFYLKASETLFKIPEFASVVENDHDNMIDCIERLVITKVYDIIFEKIKSESRDDHIFFTKVRYLSWVNENHLQLPSKLTYLPNLVTKFCDIQAATRKLSKLRVPLDKLKCIKYCCLQLFALMAECESDKVSNADLLIPLLIFFIIKTNPWNLKSEIQFINKFASEKTLHQGQEGYCYTSFIGAVSIINDSKGSSFSITDEEYIANILKTKTDADIRIEGINQMLDRLKETQNKTWIKLFALKELIAKENSFSL